MTHRLTRRRFVQLALAGTAAVAGVPLARRVLAQPANLVVLGVRPGTIPPTATSAAPAAVPLLVESLDVASGQVQTLQTPQFLPNGTPLLRSNEALTGVTVLANGTLAVAITPVVSSGPTRLTLLSTPPRVVTIPGLAKDEQLGSVQETVNGRLLGLVGHKNGTAPVRLVTVDPLTGSFTPAAALPQNQQFNTLAQCSDGTLYATAIRQGGATDLLQLDLAQQRVTTLAPLHVNGIAWNNGLQSLVCASGGQLLALGALRYKTPNALYTVDVHSGAMTAVRDFDVARMTLARPLPVATTPQPTVTTLVPGVTPPPPAATTPVPLATTTGPTFTPVPTNTP